MHVHGSGKASLKMDVINPPSLHPGPTLTRSQQNPWADWGAVWDVTVIRE